MEITQLDDKRWTLDYVDVHGDTVFKSKNGVGEQFHDGGWKKTNRWPRLYNLNKIRKAENVLLTDDESNLVALAPLFDDSQYILVGWHGGPPSLAKVDFSPLSGKSVLIWTNHDNGITAADLAARCQSIDCDPIKVVNMSEAGNIPLGFGPKDLLATGAFKDYDSALEWAKEKVTTVQKLRSPEVERAVQAESKRAASSEPSPGTVTGLYAGMGVNHFKNGKPWPTVENARLMIEKMEELQAFEVAYDTFTNDILIRYGKEPAFTDLDSPQNCAPITAQFRKINEGDPSEVMRITELAFLLDGTSLKANHFDRAFKNHVYVHRRINSARIWFENLPQWDGKKRIDTFFEDYMGVVTGEYVKACNNWLFMSIANRALAGDEGYKCDEIMILEGKEGVYKSSALRELVGKNMFAELDGKIGTKDFIMAAQGHLIVELPEIQALGGVGQEKIKSFASITHDSIRPPYGRVVQTNPRNYILVGTTNDDDYLDNLQGNRRFLPIRTCETKKKIDIEGIKRDCRQFWAETYARWKENPDTSASVFNDKAWEAQRIEVSERTGNDSILDTITKYLITLAKEEKNWCGNELRFYSTEFFSYMGVELKDKSTKIKINRTMRKHYGLKSKPVRDCGVLRRINYIDGEKYGFKNSPAVDDENEPGFDSSAVDAEEYYKQDKLIDD